MTLQKIIILEDIAQYDIINNNDTKIKEILQKFKYIPFGCKIFYSFGFDDINESGKNIEITS